MYAIINQQPLPENSLRLVIIALGGGVSITGEAINQQDRLDVDEVLEKLHEGDTVEFDVEDHDYHQFRGAGKIMLLKREEGGIETLMRIKYQISLEHIR